jgi:hypothetical protein
MSNTGLTEEKGSINTDRELFREDLHDPMDPSNHYSPSIHVTIDGRIGIDVGGSVIVMSIQEWHKLGSEDAISYIPRRIRLDRMTKEELAIYNMVGDIENLGAHPLLTDVVVLLQQARDKLADWVEEPASVETSTFSKELENLINKHGKENRSNTPDFLLAEFLENCLQVYNHIVTKRDNWNK